MGLSIRAATPNDLDTVVTLISEYYAFDHLAFDDSIQRPAASALISSPEKGVIWLLEEDGAVQGYAVMVVIHGIEFGGTCAWLDEFYIRESHRGKGWGREAVEFLIRECHSRGIVALRLEVEDMNSRARKVYEKLGFLKHERDIMTIRLATKR